MMLRRISKAACSEEIRRGIIRSKQKGNVMKPYRLLFPAVLLAVSLAACSPAKKESASASEAPETAISSDSETAEADSSGADASETADNVISFSTTDIDGNPVSLEDFRDNSLIMINFWEPWCSPCVGEMPDLQKLYEKYRDDGFVILGIFSSSELADVQFVLENTKATYPILRFTDALYPLTSDYVPTSVFLDGSGHLLSEEPYIGANSYSGWEKIIQTYLDQLSGS